MTTHHDMLTTTLLVDTPVDFTLLTNRLRLIRYAVPQRFRFMKATYAFPRLHAELKERFNQPYHFFSYDKPEPSILAIYTLQDTVQEIKIPFLDSNPLLWKQVAWGDIDLHLVVKLLQANYFKSTKRAAFVSQNKYYIQAKPDGSGVLCLQVEIKGAMKNPDVPAGIPQEFNVIGHATRFIRTEKAKIEQDWKILYPYFRRMSPKDGQAFFTQLAPSEIESFEGDVYRIFHNRRDPASLNYHQQHRPEYARGHILYQFLTAFIAYLNEHGLQACQKVRTFTKYKVEARNAYLPIKNLGTITLLDNRLNQTAIPLTAYQQLLSTAYPQLTFDGATEMSTDLISPVLIIQDYEAEDFEPSGKLESLTDPYKAIYQAYPHIAKQSINVNTNTAADSADAQEYLQYDLLSLDDPNDRYDLRFDVCLNELYLKNIVVAQRTPADHLPGFPAPDQLTLFDAVHPEPFAFLRKKTYNGISYSTLVYFDDPALRLVDLRDPQQRKQLYSLLHAYNLDWESDVIEPFKKKYRRKEESSENDIVRYDFILAPHTVIELEDIEEQVLYEYDTIIARKENLDLPYPIESFKLFSEERHPSQNSTQAILDDDDGIPHEMPSQERLRRYNAFLDRLAQSRMTISFNDLTSGALMEEIADIFGIKPDAKGKYKRTILKRQYQRRGKFLSDKGVDVQAYSGIWYDEEHCFMVGSPNGLNAVQARAQRIRKFDVYTSGAPLDVTPLLELMAVKFVRHEQYTVYPYFFHLVDLYIESVLMHDQSLSTDEE